MNHASRFTPDSARGFSPTICARCGNAFGCGVNAATPCWCASLPTLTQPGPVGATCLCPACLAHALAAQAQQ